MPRDARGHKNRHTETRARSTARSIHSPAAAGIYALRLSMLCDAVSICVGVWVVWVSMETLVDNRITEPAAVARVIRVFQSRSRRKGEIADIVTGTNRRGIEVRVGPAVGVHFAWPVIFGTLIR